MMKSLSLRCFLVGVVALGVAVAFAADADGNGIDDLCELSSSSASGDPHFVGFRGQRFDFDGKPFRVFSILSHPNTQLSARFLPDGRWTGKTVMGEVGLQNFGDRLHVVCSNRTVQVTLNGIELSSDIPMPFGSGGMAVRSTDGIEAITDALVARIVIHKTRKLQCFLDMEVSLTDLSEDVDGILGRTASVDSDLPGAHNTDLFLVKSDNVFATDFPANKFVGEERATAPSIGGNGRRGRSLLSMRSLQQTAGCGCMSSNAMNYDSLATLEDGSCYYLENTSGASDSAVVVLSGDCASVVEAEIASAIALSMGVDVSELTISTIECDEGAGGTRRLLQTDSNIFVVLSVETANIPDLETLLSTPSINLPTGFLFSSSHRIQPTARMNAQRFGGQNPCREGLGAKCQPGEMCKLGKQEGDAPECIGLLSPISGPCFPNACSGQLEGLTSCTSPNGTAECTHDTVSFKCAPSGCTCSDSPCANQPDGLTSCSYHSNGMQCTLASASVKCPVLGCEYPVQACEVIRFGHLMTSNCGGLTTLSTCTNTKHTSGKTCMWNGSSCVTGSMPCTQRLNCNVGSSSFSSCAILSNEYSCKYRYQFSGGLKYRCNWDPASNSCFVGTRCL